MYRRYTARGSDNITERIYSSKLAEQVRRGIKYTLGVKRNKVQSEILTGKISEQGSAISLRIKSRGGENNEHILQQF